MPIYTQAGKFIVLVFTVINFNLAFSQDPEPEIKSKAEKTFKNENFVEASKLYSQLLTFNQADPFYNYRYGVCLLYNSRKKADAIKHLTYASKAADFDAEVFYYLGKAYHLDYNFNEAIKNYNNYKAKAGGKLNKDLDVDQQIKMSENGKRLLTSMNEVIVISKQEIENKSFFRIYELNDIGGNILVTAQFQSKIDKKRNHIPLIHFPNNPKRIFYSSYGEDELNGKDIYMRQRLPDGTWSMPQKIKGAINTKYDEDYPYIHPKGDYLYFSSKGHNSMGGYDIFRSKFNEETGSFEEPENIDFPISSPDNDLFYIVDSLDENAYFSSSRQSLDDKIHVYKVKVEKVPIQFVAIKASFSSVVNPTNKKVSVEVYDQATNNKVGTYNANQKGNVLITFPKGGKYEYLVRVDGVDKEFRQIISVPFLKVFKPLKQKIVHDKKEAGDIVTVINLFDEEIDESYEVMSELAKIRSELNPNLDQFDLAELAGKADNKEIYSKLGMGKMNDFEVLLKLEELVDNQEKKNENLLKIEETAVAQSLENIKNITQLQEDLKATVANANAKNGSEKRFLFEDAGKIVNELNFLENYSNKLLTTADSLVPVVQSNKDEIKKYDVVVEELRKVYKTGDLKEFGNKLSDALPILLELKKENPEFVTGDLNNQIMVQHEEMNRLEPKIKGMNSQIESNENEIKELKLQLEKAKSKEKAKVQKAIDDKEYENKLLKEDLKSQNNKLITANDKLVELEKSLAYFQDILNSTAPSTSAKIPDITTALKKSDNQNTRTLKTYVEQQLRELGIDMLTLKSPSMAKQGERSKSSLSRNFELTNRNNSGTNSNDAAKNRNAANGNATNGQNNAQNASGTDSKSSDVAKNTNAANGNTTNDQNNAQNSSETDSKSSDATKNTNAANGNVTNGQNNAQNASGTDSKSSDATKNTNTADGNSTSGQNNTKNASGTDSKSSDVAKNTNTSEGNSTSGQNNAQNVSGTDSKSSDVAKNRNTSNGNSASGQNSTQNVNGTESKSSDVAKNTNTSNGNSASGQNSTQNANGTDSKSSDVAKNAKTSNGNSSMSTNPDNGIVSGISKEFLSNKTAISSNPNFTDEQKMKALLRQDKNLKFLISKEIEKLESKIYNEPENKTYQSDVTELKVLKEKVEADIVKAEADLTSKYPNTATASAWNEEQITDMISPNHVKTVKRIEINSGLSEISKAKLTKIEDENFILSIKKDRARLNEELSKKPGNNDLKNEVKLLDNIILETQKNIDKNGMLLSTYTVNETLKTIGSDLINSDQTSISEETSNTVISKYRNELLKGNTSVITQENNNLDDLGKQNNVLNNYYNLLSEKQYDIEKQLAVNTNQPSLKEENQAITNELETVRKKLDNVEYQMDELDKQILAENYIVLNGEISYLKQELNELQIQLKDKDTPKKDKAELSKKKLENQSKQNETYEKLNKLQLALINKYPPNKLRNRRQAKLPQNILDSLKYERFDKTDSIVNAQMLELKDTKSASKKSKALPTLLDKQEANSIIAQHLLYNAQMKKHLRQVTKYSDNMYTLQSTKTLQKTKYGLQSSLEETESMIIKEKINLTNAKKKKKMIHVNNISALKKEVTTIEQLQRDLEVEILKREKYLEEFKKKDVKQLVVSDQDRATIKANPQFETVKALYVQRKMTYEAMKLLIDNLENAKDNYNKAILDFANDPVKTNKQFANQMFEALKTIYKQYYELQNKYEGLTLAYQKASGSLTALPKYEQLFEEAYDEEVAILAAKAKQAANGQAQEGNDNNNQADLILAEDKINFSNEIPLAGTNYQIFIGNLDKPLNSSLINKLGRVNAELLDNGQTAYYSQISNSSAEAEKLLKEIQTAGYPNAQIVAYNEGQKTSYDELKANEMLAINKQSQTDNKSNKNKTSNKTGKSNTTGKSTSGKVDNTNKQQNEIAKNTTPPSSDGKNSSATGTQGTNQNVIENSTTNKNGSSQTSGMNEEKSTPVNKLGKSTKNSSSKTSFDNLINATPIESKPGLFFTVQVGAFMNKKFPTNLREIQQVFSKTFADGVIRYSTGVFHSVEEAKGMKSQVMTMGIMDAFITAYYKGERITIAEAERLIREGGATILEVK